MFKLPPTYKEPKILNNKYIIKNQISSGSFGIVYLAFDKLTKEQVAVKLEKDGNASLATINRESHLLLRLKGITGVPRIMWYGQEQGYNVMVIELLGRDLGELLRVRKRFTLKTCLHLLKYLITTMQLVHKKGVIHRDLKPENILIGKEGQEDQIYLVDFGVSKLYLEHGKHISYRDGKSFTGTTRYASIAAHLGHEMGRKDDLESLYYVIIYTLKGKLPWQNLPPYGDKDRTEVVGESKNNMKPAELCKDLPPELCESLTYLRSLKFAQEPNYDLLRSLAQQAADRLKIDLDGSLDWCVKKQSSQSKSPQSPVKSPAKKPRSTSPNIPTIDLNAPTPKNAKEKQLIEQRKGSVFLLLPPDLGSPQVVSTIGSFSSIAMKYVPTICDNKQKEDSVKFCPEESKMRQEIQMSVSSPDIFVSEQCKRKSLFNKSDTLFDLDEENPDDEPTLEEKYTGLVKTEVHASFKEQRQQAASSLVFFKQ